MLLLLFICCVYARGGEVGIMQSYFRTPSCYESYPVQTFYPVDKCIHEPVPYGVQYISVSYDEKYVKFIYYEDPDCKYDIRKTEYLLDVCWDRVLYTKSIPPRGAYNYIYRDTGCENLDLIDIMNITSCNTLIGLSSYRYVCTGPELSVHMFKDPECQEETGTENLTHTCKNMGSYYGTMTCAPY